MTIEVVEKSIACKLSKRKFQVDSHDCHNKTIDGWEIPINQHHRIVRKREREPGTTRLSMFCPKVFTKPKPLYLALATLRLLSQKAQQLREPSNPIAARQPVPRTKPSLQATRP